MAAPASPSGEGSGGSDDAGRSAPRSAPRPRAPADPAAHASVGQNPASRAVNAKNFSRSICIVPAPRFPRPHATLADAGAAVKPHRRAGSRARARAALAHDRAAAMRPQPAPVCSAHARNNSRLTPAPPHTITSTGPIHARGGLRS